MDAGTHCGCLFAERLDAVPHRSGPLRRRRGGPSPSHPEAERVPTSVRAPNHIPILQCAATAPVAKTCWPTNSRPTLTHPRAPLATSGHWSSWDISTTWLLRYARPPTDLSRWAFPAFPAQRSRYRSQDHGTCRWAASCIWRFLDRLPHKYSPCCTGDNRSPTASLAISWKTEGRLL